MITDQIGCGVISFNRPVYLVQTLASLEQQTHLDKLDFHLFQDGAKNRFSLKRYADPEDIVAVADAFREADLPNKMVHIHKHNVGTAINQFQAIEYMTANYEYVIILEDDVVLSPYYLRLARVMFGQVKDRKDIFSFSLGFRRVCQKDEIEQNLDKVKFGRPHFWDMGLVAERWERARPHFMEYYEIVKDVDYGQRNPLPILKLFLRKGWPHTATSQDSGRDMASHAAGMKRCVTVVNRGISIGQEGTHWTPVTFEAKGYADQVPYVFESDAMLEEFELP